MQELKINPVIEKHLWSLADSEFAELKNSIQKEGIREKIIVWQQDNDLTIVDGHNRHKIAKELDIQFEIIKKDFSGIDEVLEFIDRNQLGRRNLTDEQRQIIIGRMYEAEKVKGFKGNRFTAAADSESESIEYDFINENTKSDIKPKKVVVGDKLSPTTMQDSHKTAKSIAAKTGVNEKTVRRSADFNNAYEKVKKIDSDVAEKIAGGQIKDAITKLSAIKDDDTLEKVVSKLKDGCNKVKDAVNAVKKDEIKENKPFPLPDGKFDVILADPPWKYDFSATQNREIENQYPTMDIKDIESLDIPSADNSVLLSDSS